MSSTAAIEKNHQLRKAKDELKAFLREDYIPSVGFNGVVIPKNTHVPSVVDWAMQWYFNGYLLGLQDGLLVVDPGVNFYSRFTTTGFTIKDVRGIFVSHMHLDHCGDLQVFLDMVSKTKTPIDLILPINVIDDVLPEYYRKLVYEDDAINLIVLQDGMETTVHTHWPALARFEPIRLFHTVPHSFGFSIYVNDKKVAYLSDTGYSTRIKTSRGEMTPSDDGVFEAIVAKHTGIKVAVRDATVLICNINDLFYNRHSATHLAGWDVIDILEGSGVKKLILQHLSSYDAHGVNSNKAMYRDFFRDMPYECIVPTGNEQKVLI